MDQTPSRPPDDDAPDPSPGAAPEEIPEDIPWGQRFFDRPFLLLILGTLIMAIFFTGWGLFEITSLDPAPLP